MYCPIMSPPLSMSSQHATEVKHYIIGKPSSAYFKAVLRELGVAPEMVSHFNYI